MTMNWVMKGDRPGQMMGDAEAVEWHRKQVAPSRYALRDAKNLRAGDYVFWTPRDKQVVDVFLQPDTGFAQIVFRDLGQMVVGKDYMFLVARPTLRNPSLTIVGSHNLDDLRRRSHSKNVAAFWLELQKKLAGLIARDTEYYGLAPQELRANPIVTPSWAEMVAFYPSILEDVPIGGEQPFVGSWIARAQAVWIRLHGKRDLDLANAWYESVAVRDELKRLTKQHGRAWYDDDGRNP